MVEGKKDKKDIQVGMVRMVRMVHKVRMVRMVHQDSIQLAYKEQAHNMASNTTEEGSMEAGSMEEEGSLEDRKGKKDMAHMEDNKVEE